MKESQEIHSEDRKVKRFHSNYIVRTLWTMIRIVFRYINIIICKICVNSGFLSSIYYLLINRSFYREHASVLHGMLNYRQNAGSYDATSYLLRRNIHRLEKGLIMKFRRSVFASDYIEQTVRTYICEIRKLNKNTVGHSELQWAYDVLSEYFKIVDSDSNIERARRLFHKYSPQKESFNLKPYKRKLTQVCPVGYLEFIELSRRRRSIRWYLPKKVPRDLLDKAIQAASLAPSACNRQAFHFHIFDDPELVQTVSEIPIGASGFFHNFPAIVVLTGHLGAYFNERDRHVIYIDASLSAMAFMYALETLGLSSCPLNWPNIADRERRIARLLNLSPDKCVIMLISVGYPDPEGMVAYSCKKDIEQIRSYN